MSDYVPQIKGQPVKSLTLLSLSIFTIFATHAHANTLKHVTIYQGSALVERTSPVSAGEQTVVFDCLAHTLDNTSVQISAPDSVSIGEISIESLSGSQAKHCQNDINNLQTELNHINAKLKAAQTTLAFLENLGKADSITLSGDITSQANQLANKTEEAELAINTLTEQKEQLEAQMREQGSTSTQVRKVSVRLASPRAEQISLSYVANRANWQPQYQAKLNTKTGKLDISLQALVSQQTGEHWRNAKVTLSTSQPSRQTSIYTPNPMPLNLETPIAARAKFATMNMVAPAAAPIMLEASAVEEPEVESYHVTSEQTGDIVSYSPSQLLTLASNGKRTTLTLDNKSASATLINRINLDGDLSAYWYAKAPRLDGTWLPAGVQLYRDGNFVGTGQFNQETLNTWGLGFGKNSQIIARHLNSDSNKGSSGLFGGKQTQTLNKAVEITNRLPTNATLELVSGIPVAKDSQITVKSSYSPTPQGDNWQDMQGVAYWQLSLAPNASTKVEQSHTITYPKDSTLYGLR